MRALLLAVLVALAAIAVPAGATPTELELAYQREFAYLEAEKAALEQRLVDLAAETNRRVSSAESELTSLQARLLTLRSRRTRAEDALGDALRASDSVTEARDMIDSTLFQADTSLPGVDLPEAETGDEQVAALTLAYTEGARVVTEAGTVRASPGSWFLPSGERVEGQVVHIGRIATFGIGDQAGALVPAGDGKLQLRDTGASATARALLAGERPQPLGLFAYEDTGKRIEEATEKTLWSTLQAGGIVGGVILVLGAVGVVLCALRAFGIALSARGQGAVRNALARLDQGRWDEALRAVTAARGAGPRLLQAMLPLGARDRERLEDRAAEVLLLETPRIERFGAAILVIAAVSPLLGLLGTVTGMIGTFEVITEFGTGDPRMLSGGISEALVTTQLGLIVAIPMLLVGNLLNRYGERVIGLLEVAAVGVVTRAAHPTDEAATVHPVQRLAPTPTDDEDATTAVHAHG